MSEKRATIKDIEAKVDKLADIVAALAANVGEHPKMDLDPEETPSKGKTPRSIGKKAKRSKKSTKPKTEGVEFLVYEGNKDGFAQVTWVDKNENPAPPPEDERMILRSAPGWRFHRPDEKLPGRFWGPAATIPERYADSEMLTVEQVEDWYATLER